MEVLSALPSKGEGTCGPAVVAHAHVQEEVSENSSRPDPDRMKPVASLTESVTVAFFFFLKKGILYSTKMTNFSYTSTQINVLNVE